MKLDQNRSVNVQTFLNDNPFSAFQWVIFALCFLVVLADGFDTAAIGFIAPSLLKEWGLTRPDLAPVLTAALWGLAAGALISGPFADIVGRKRMLSGAILLFGAFCLGSAYSQSLTQLVALRFLTGLGLGAAMPNAITMMSEFCPDNKRATLTNAMFCGFPLGAALGGFLAAWMIPSFGWRSVLMLGGVAPLAIGAAMIAAMPESVRYMVARSEPAERVRKVLSRIAPLPASAQSFVTNEAAPAVGARSSGPGLVLSAPYIVGSLMLWLTYFMGLVIFYALISWMPLLFKDAGVEPRTATLISALFPLGGCGAILSGWLMDRFNANRIIAICYGLTAVFIFAIGQASGNIGLLMLFVFVGGALMNTAQSSMGALAAAFYPTQGRATGVAWMLGVGRFGGVAGPALVAYLSSQNLGFAAIFAYVAIPGLIAAAALTVKQFVHPETKTAAGAGAIDAMAH
jgi:AAHS family 4-hydroxybenzoate transporter-like MFS transporter